MKIFEETGDRREHVEMEMEKEKEKVESRKNELERERASHGLTGREVSTKIRTFFKKSRKNEGNPRLLSN